jgi:hypothetical protein
VILTASFRITLKAHLIASLGPIPFLAIGLPIARWLQPEDKHIPSIPLFVFAAAITLQAMLPMFVAAFAWYRLQSWCFSPDGVEHRVFNRRVRFYPWAEIMFISVRLLGSVLITSGGERRYLAFVDPNAIRELIPQEKRLRCDRPLM